MVRVAYSIYLKYNRVEKGLSLEKHSTKAGKKMYRTVVLDDEDKILKSITECVQAIYGKEGIYSEIIAINSAEKFLKLIDEKVVDILFLDIDMPYFTGMDIAQFIMEKRMKTLIIFVTSHDTLVYKTFTYRPFGFIRKTYLEKELWEVVKRISVELENMNENIVVKTSDKTFAIKKDDIIYIESQGNYVNIYIEDGCEKVRETLGNMEKELFQNDFVRCHKGYIVNVKCINKITSGELLLNNGIHIPVGRNYEKGVKRKLLEMMR